MHESNQLTADPKFLASLIDSLDAGFAVVDAKGRFQVWNAANSRILGKGAAQDLDPTQWPAYYGLHCPIEHRLLNYQELPLARAMLEDRYVEQELIVINETFPQGRWIKVTARPFHGEDREVVGGAALIRDVTNEKASLLASQMMSWFFRASDDAILGVNLEGTVLLWNPGAERLLGWKAEEIIGQTAYRLLPEERHFEIPLLAQRARENQELPPRETLLLHKEGYPISVSRSITPMRDSNGTPIGGVIVARDISQLKKAKKELEYSNDQLRMLSARQVHLLEQQMAALARELHDEFGQQLAAMRFELAWVERHLQGEDPRMEERLESLNELLNSTLVGLRRVSKQMRPPLLEELGLVHAIDDLLSTLSGRYPLQAHFECCPQLHFNSEAALAIFRIIQEALTNVVRHSGADQVHIHIAREGDRVVVSVRDNGRGISSQPRPAGHNFGILGMQERALSWSGLVVVANPPEGGTRVEANFPADRVLKG